MVRKVDSCTHVGLSKGVGRPSPSKHPYFCSVFVGTKHAGWSIPDQKRRNVQECQGSSFHHQEVGSLEGIGHGRWAGPIGKSSNFMEVLDHRARKHTKSAGMLQHIMTKWWFGTWLLWLSIYWEWKIIPTDELHHFSEGWRKTTNEMRIDHHHRQMPRRIFLQSCLSPSLFDRVRTPPNPRKAARRHLGLLENG